MKLIILFLFVGLASTSLGNPEASLSVRQRRDVDILGNTRNLIQQLIINLQKAALQANDAIVTFVNGIQQQVQLFGQQIVQDLQKLQNAVQESIKNIANKINGTGPAVKACIEKQQDAAEQLFANAQENSHECASQYVDDIQNMVDSLTNLTNGAVNYTRDVVDQVDGCSKNNTGVFSIGACLGALVVKTEYKSVTFAAQSTVLMSKINLSLITLPAALEVCAGRSLLTAGSDARAIVSEIATCSYASIFTSSDSSGDISN